MTDAIYEKLAHVLDTLPNGFPKTQTGVEIRILKKVFTPLEAELFCDLRLKFETPEEIAARTGRPLEGLDDKLYSMWEKGQLFMVDFGTVRVYRMLPWVFGIYEFQLNRMDREFAELCEEYAPVFGKQFFSHNPQLMQVVPVEKELTSHQEALTYEQVSSIIEKGQSFGVAHCICKKEQHILDKGCDKPLEVCMGIAPVPGVFDNHHWGRPVSKEEAYALLEKAEEAALVHLTYNLENGHFFICNCCGCCCGVLRSINEWGFSKSVNSSYYAVIDEEACTVCGVCKDERCQVNAVEEGEDGYRIIREKCIGCALCISTCPGEAITLVRKPEEEIIPRPKDENIWYEERAKARGVNYDAYK